MYIYTPFSIFGINNSIFEDDTMFTGFTCWAFLNNEPKGWLLCDGREVSRTKYSELFQVIGIMFGEGNGSTTFNLPNAQGVFLQGKSEDESLGTIKEAGLPNITGHFTGSKEVRISNAVGCFTASNKSQSGQASVSGSDSHTVNFNASLSSPIYGNSSTVQPPAIIANLFIKY